MLVVIVLQNMPFSKSFEMQIWFKYDSAEWEKLAWSERLIKDPSNELIIGFIFIIIFFLHSPTRS